MNGVAYIQNSSYHSAISNQAEYSTKIQQQHPHQPYIKFAIFSIFFTAASKNTNMEILESALILQSRISAILSLRPDCDPKICKLP